MERAQPLNRWPDRRSSVYADTTSTMSAASFTRSIDSCENRAIRQT